MDHDWGLSAPHAAGVVPSVALRGKRDAQTADGAVLQKVGFHAEKKTFKTTSRRC